MKCAGLSDEELQRRAVAPSALSLLGLVRHIAEVERAWFRRVFEDRAAPMMWSPPGWSISSWRTTPAPPLGPRPSPPGRPRSRTGHQPRWGEDVSLRMVMVHVLLEYARHNGHADLLREGVDGTVGA